MEFIPSSELKCPESAFLLIIVWDPSFDTVVSTSASDCL